MIKFTPAQITSIRDAFGGKAVLDIRRFAGGKLVCPPGAGRTRCNRRLNEVHRRLHMSNGPAWAHTDKPAEMAQEVVVDGGVML
jgi:hypothetical protein